MRYLCKSKHNYGNYFKILRKFQKSYFFLENLPKKEAGKKELLQNILKS